MKVRYKHGGKYELGGGIDPTKLSPEKLVEYTRKLQAQLNAANSSRYATLDEKKADIANITKKLMEAKAAKTQPQKG
tara:strand:+ start:5437 stop:5667 length:231 start_codon:yes stop_codon:yes gene_type:complete